MGLVEVLFANLPELARLLPGQQEQAANVIDAALRAVLGSGANSVPKR